MRFAAVFLALGSLLFGSATAASANTVNVYVFNFMFSTDSTGKTKVDAVINTGDTIHWIWKSGTHSTTSVKGSIESWDSGDLSSGTFDHTFTHNGVITYYCNIHGSDNGNGTASGMKATVTVNAPVTAQLTFNPRAVIGGNSSVGTLSVSAAPATDEAFTLKATTGSAAVANLPAKVTVTKGKKTATFTLSTHVVDNATSVTVQASATGLSTTGALTVKPSLFAQLNLVSDENGFSAASQDPNLANPWGIAFAPTGPFWVADNATGVSTIYDGKGTVNSLVVKIPGLTTAAKGAPSGIVFNGTTYFIVKENSVKGPSLFIFSTEDGTLAGWNSSVDLKNAITVADMSGKGAVYKGLALGVVGNSSYLFATNFHSGQIDVFDGNFKFVRSVTDSKIPAGYAPFGIQVLGDRLFVTFAKQDADKHDDVAGAGFGFVDEVQVANGQLKLTQLIAHGQLNAPWGLALAPKTFGRYGGALLVGNFGDGTINAYDPKSGAFLGTLRNSANKPLSIDGLWGLTFGNGTKAGSVDTLYFSAGIKGEAHGLFGQIQPIPAQ